jgi:hypothetical protein
VELWCEWIPPWALQKECFHVLFETLENNKYEGKEGINKLTSLFVERILGKPNAEKRNSHSSCRDGDSVLPAEEVLFWNLFLSFRMRGLPVSFLFSAGDLLQAFPLMGAEV